MEIEEEGKKLRWETKKHEKMKWKVKRNIKRE